MSASDCAIFASKPFKFIVQGKPLSVHASLVCECSRPLDRMINGDFSEAEQGFAVLEDVDEATFVLFIRWTYTDDYPSAEHSRKKGKKNKKDKSEPRDARPRETFTHHDEISLKDSFILQTEPMRRSRQNTTDIGVFHSNKDRQEDYTEVFLGHARMYVFAEKYDILKLQKLALSKLQDTLAYFTLYHERVGDITSLLKYVYANTAETKEGIEDIRTMLAHYVGTEIRTLLKYGAIKDLMLDHEEMLGDFLKMLALRVS